MSQTIVGGAIALAGVVITQAFAEYARWRSTRTARRREAIDRQREVLEQLVALLPLIYTEGAGLLELRNPVERHFDWSGRVAQALGLIARIRDDELRADAFKVHAHVAKIFTTNLKQPEIDKVGAMVKSLTDRLGAQARHLDAKQDHRH